MLVGLPAIADEGPVYEPGTYPVHAFDSSDLLAIPHYEAPPAEYDHPFMGRLRVIIVDDLKTLENRCHYSLIVPVVACARPRAVFGEQVEKGMDCVIVRFNDDIIVKDGGTVNVVMRHELAHCNGWPADHPRSR
jgi:hypothetical protein